MIFLFMSGQHLDRVIVEAKDKDDAVHKLSLYEATSKEAILTQWTLLTYGQDIVEYE